MRLNRFAVAAAGLSLLLAAPAWAQAQDIDGWTLNDDGQSCAISLDSADGSFLTMLNDGAGGAEGLAFVGTELTGVVENQPVTLQYSVDGGQWTNFTAYGISITGGAGYHLMDFPVAIFANKRLSGSMEIRRDGVVIHSFPLDQVQRPAKAMIECGKKY